MSPVVTYGVVTYGVGLCCASACAPLDISREDVERAVNADHPTGIPSPWRISDDETFATGQPMPNLCEQDSERQHWLLKC